MMELKVNLPQILISAGWKIKFEGIEDNRFELNPDGKRKIVIDLILGNDFTKDDVQNTTDRNITIYLYGNNIRLGENIH
jgi:hypothetical protein